MWNSENKGKSYLEMYELNLGENINDYEVKLEIFKGINKDPVINGLKHDLGLLIHDLYGNDFNKKDELGFGILNKVNLGDTVNIVKYQYNTENNETKIELCLGKLGKETVIKIKKGYNWYSSPSKSNNPNGHKITVVVPYKVTSNNLYKVKEVLNDTVKRYLRSKLWELKKVEECIKMLGAVNNIYDIKVNQIYYYSDDENVNVSIELISKVYWLKNKKIMINGDTGKNNRLVNNLIYDSKIQRNYEKYFKDAPYTIMIEDSVLWDNYKGYTTVKYNEEGSYVVLKKELYGDEETLKFVKERIDNFDLNVVQKLGKIKASKALKWLSSKGYHLNILEYKGEDLGDIIGYIKDIGMVYSGLKTSNDKGYEEKLLRVLKTNIKEDLKTTLYKRVKSKKPLEPIQLMREFQYKGDTYKVYIINDKYVKLKGKRYKERVYIKNGDRVSKKEFKNITKLYENLKDINKENGYKS